VGTNHIFGTCDDSRAVNLSGRSVW